MFTSIPYYHNINKGSHHSTEIRLKFSYLSTLNNEVKLR